MGLGHENSAAGIVKKTLDLFHAALFHISKEEIQQLRILGLAVGYTHAIQ